MIHTQEQAQNENAMYYGYYSQHMYYPPYMMVKFLLSRIKAPVEIKGIITVLEMCPPLQFLQEKIQYEDKIAR